ncbi:MAG: hypothetical protein ACXW2W_09165 [Telluria sp.]
MLDVLERFRTDVNTNAQIQRIVKGWNTDVALESRDVGHTWRLCINEGLIGQIAPGNDASFDDCPMRIVGDSAVMRGLFEGRINGIRANNDGLIEIYGPMSDQVKLDAIALILWGI